MNKKGFTLVELLAVLVLLGIVLGITIVSVNNIFDNTKEKSEDAFVATIKDAMEMYLTSSDASELFNGSFMPKVQCSNPLEKSHNSSVKVYRVTIPFEEVIESEYEPITAKDLVNPANKDVDCAAPSDISVTVYRDEDYVYYYNINKSIFGCLTGTGVISNLPKGYSC